jgi:hypothetical protein
VIVCSGMRLISLAGYTVLGMLGVTDDQSSNDHAILHNGGKDANNMRQEIFHCGRSVSAFRMCIRTAKLLLMHDLRHSSTTR